MHASYLLANKQQARAMWGPGTYDVVRHCLGSNDYIETVRHIRGLLGFETKSLGRLSAERSIDLASRNDCQDMASWTGYFQGYMLLRRVAFWYTKWRNGLECTDVCFYPCMTI